MFRSASRFCLVAALVAVSGCAEEDDEGLGDPGPPTMTADGPIPEEGGNALLEWLDGRGYFAWEGESAPHGSDGPHFGTVRTYLDPTLLESLEAGNAEHPAGAATVKELYGGGDDLLGWSVSLKREDESDGGNNWYWFEIYQGDVLADGDGLSICTGCHGGGTDYVLTPFPLQ